MRRLAKKLLPFVLIGLLFAGYLELVKVAGQTAAAGQADTVYAMKNGRPATEGSE